MKKILLFIFSFFIMISSSNALTLTCPTVVSPNESISCIIEEKEYIGIKANYKLDDVFTYKNLSNINGKKYYSSNKGFSIGNITNNKISTNLNIDISSKVKLNKDYKIILTNIEVVDKNYKNIKLDDIIGNIKVLSDNNTLKNLEVINEKLTPKFNSNTYEYKLETYNDSINIKATSNDNNSKISGDIGKIKLNYGANVLTIKVTSQRGNTRNYYIYATRKIKKNNDITLKSLTISNGKLEFNKNKFIYLVDVDYNIEDIKVEAIPNNNKSVVKIDKPEKLEVGKNNIIITVTAEDGTIGKYSIIVTRKDKLSSDATIKNIIIKDYELNFKSDIFEYELEIKKENKLDIKVELNDENAKYKIIGNNKLNNNSIITIKVEAMDGTIKEYKIKIVKNDILEDSIVEENSNSIARYINIKSITMFVILILVIIILKVIRGKQNKDK